MPGGDKGTLRKHKQMCNGGTINLSMSCSFVQGQGAHLAAMQLWKLGRLLRQQQQHGSKSLENIIHMVHC